MKTIILLGSLSLALAAPMMGQDLSVRPLQKLIDCPSSGGPEPHSYDFELRAYPGDGVLIGFTVGLFNRFALGLFYGGTGIIGYTDPDWNDQPGVVVSYRIIDESYVLPAFAVGYASQGYGYWDAGRNRYQYKAKGFYGALGKNYAWGTLGEFGAHLGVNMNPTEGEDRGMDVFAAVTYGISEQLTLLWEYSLGLNDRNDSLGYGKGRGYMNLGLRWTFAERLAFDLNLKDVLINQSGSVRRGMQFGREIRISYVEKIG